MLVTGGFRSYNFCNEVIEKGEVDLIGMARPFITNREDISNFLKGDVINLNDITIRTGIKQIEDSAEGGFYVRQLIRFSKGKSLNLKINPLLSSLFCIFYEFKMMIYKNF